MTGLCKASLGVGMCIVQTKSYFHWLEEGMVCAFRLIKQDCWLPSIPNFILPGLDIPSSLLFSSLISLFQWIQPYFCRYTSYVEHLAWSGPGCWNRSHRKYSDRVLHTDKNRIMGFKRTSQSVTWR